MQSDQVILGIAWLISGGDGIMIGCPISHRQHFLLYL